jgi:hypothetical protein
MAWWRFSRRVEEWREQAREHIGDNRIFAAFAIGLLAYLLATVALGIYWSREPTQFSEADAARRALPKQAEPLALGSTTTATLLDVIGTLLDKPGGLISNDIAPPGIWLDNMPSWEYGTLTQARDLATVLRENARRSQSNTAGERMPVTDDETLLRAEPRLNFSPDSWALPSSESQYRDAQDYLRDYLERLQAHGDKRAIFDASAGNLSHWLERVAVRLGNLSQRLSACVRPQENPLLLSAAATTEIPLTPDSKIDNIFYEARGSTWALLHFFRAAEIDYAAPLTQNNALPLLKEIIRDLEQAQAPIYSPLILNGGGFGLLANHSLVMASYVARANTAVINLRNLLVQSQPPASLQPFMSPPLFTPMQPPVPAQP